MREVLSMARRRVGASRLYWWVLLWSSFWWAIYFLLGRTLVAPTLQQVVPALQPDIFLLGEVALYLLRSGVLPLLALVLALRLLATPFLEAIIYHRLLSRGWRPRRPQVGRFYQLAVVVALCVLLLGIVVYLNFDRLLLALLERPTLLYIGLGGVLLGWWIMKVLLAVERARIAADVRYWPPLNGWISLFAARALLGVASGLPTIAAFCLSRGSGWLSGALYVACSLLLLLGRLWKVACAVAVVDC